MSSLSELRGSRDHDDRHAGAMRGERQRSGADLVHDRAVGEDGVRPDQQQVRGPNDLRTRPVRYHVGVQSHLPQVPGESSTFTTGSALEDRDPQELARARHGGQGAPDRLATAQGHHVMSSDGEPVPRGPCEAGRLVPQPVPLAAKPRFRFPESGGSRSDPGDPTPIGRPAEERPHRGLGPCEGLGDLKGRGRAQALGSGRPAVEQRTEGREGGLRQCVRTAPAVRSQAVELARHL